MRVVKIKTLFQLINCFEGGIMLYYIFHITFRFERFIIKEKFPNVLNKYVEHLEFISVGSLILHMSVF